MNTCSVCKKEFEDKYFDIEQDKCILHSNNKEKDIKLFWEKIREIIKEQDEDILVKISFEKVFFPKCEEKGLAEASHDNGTDFLELGKKEFNKKIFFKECTFWDDIDFRFITFKKGLTFEKCTFDKELNFKNKTFEKGSKVRIQNSKKIANVNFENTTFKDLADFYGSYFYDTNFFKTTFEDISVFTEAVFHKDINFKYTTFKELVLFRKTIFEQSINLEDSIIKDEMNFLESSSSKDKIKDLKVANRETARIIKNEFEKQNNIIESNKFYALEMQKREDELKLLENPLEWLIFKAHSISSNHSQSWLLALMWIFIFGLVASISHLDNINTLYITPSLFTFLMTFFIIWCTELNKYMKFLVTLMFLLLTLLNALVQDVEEPEKYKNIFDIFADKINPFSIMTSPDTITFGILIFKTVIAYLIYQFIISVRQNTRRK